MGAIERVERSLNRNERARVVALSAVNFVLALLFLMFLLADGVQAAAL